MKELWSGVRLGVQMRIVVDGGKTMILRQEGLHEVEVLKTFID